MYGLYSLSKNDKICVYLCDDFFGGEVFHKTTEVAQVYANGSISREEVTVPVLWDNGVSYIEWRGRRINLKDYDYLPVNSLDSLIHKNIRNGDFSSCTDEMIWATIQNDLSNFKVHCRMPLFESIELGYNVYKTVPCVLSDVRYQQNIWLFKVTLSPMNAEDKKTVATRDIYFSDFCDYLRDGTISLIPKTKSKKSEIVMCTPCITTIFSRLFGTKVVQSYFA